VRGRSRSAWHGGGAGHKRRIRAVRDRAVCTAPAARRARSALNIAVKDLSGLIRPIVRIADDTPEAPTRTAKQPCRGCQADRATR